MSKSVVYSENAPEPIGPYSQAIQAGNILFVSGQSAIQRTTGKIITTTIEEETNQLFEFGMLPSGYRCTDDQVILVAILVQQRCKRAEGQHEQCATRRFCQPL